jgi:thiamine-monophosphate kinase
MGEFDLIRRHFRRPAPHGSAVVLGVGDDCALLQPPPGELLAISSDMLVEGRHFLPGTDPQALGHKALAVNLSDLAAMGARPLGFTLAVSLPAVDDAWLAAFSAGLLALAQQHACPLVGGDTTAGPLNLCITVFGSVMPGRALRRDAAQAGDDLWVSGRTGEARLALERQFGTPWAKALALGADDEAALQARLHRPEPRLALGRALAGMAHAALDVSDGLAGDLGHVLAASGVGACIDETALPVAPVLARLPADHRRECLLHGGDDYELLFTADPARHADVLAAGTQSGTVVTRIGRIETTPGLRLLNPEGRLNDWPLRGFDHFGSPPASG